MTELIVKLPDIGEGVVEGEVVEWLKKVGDPIDQDEPVVIVMTDKATVELPAPKPGILAKQYVAVGEMAIKDKPLYAIAEKEVGSCPKEAKRVQASPATRKRAKELGVNLSDAKGSGPSGRVVKEDLVSSQPSSSHPSYISLPGDTVKPLVGIPRLMAENMAFSKRHIPHFSYFEQMEVTRLITTRSRFKKEAEKEGIALTYLPFIIRALSLTLKEFPLLNSNIDMESGKIIFHKQHNIGIAMAGPLGLIVPVLKGVEEMSLEALIRGYAKLKERADSHGLKKEEMKEATITVSNFGAATSRGLFATPVLNPPEVAILAVGRIQKQAIVKNGEVVAADTLTASWSFDHRVIDGAVAVSASAYFARLIENPAQLL